jgi:hypothetical protein
MRSGTTRSAGAMGRAAECPASSNGGGRHGRRYRRTLGILRVDSIVRSERVR